VTSLFPDLRYAGALWSGDAFKAIVLGGALQDNGMVSFKKELTPEDAEAIRAYVVHLAHDLQDHPPPPFAFPGQRAGAAGRAGGAAPGAPPGPGPSAGATPPPPALHQ